MNLPLYRHEGRGMLFLRTCLTVLLTTFFLPIHRSDAQELAIDGIAILEDDTVQIEFRGLDTAYFVLYRGTTVNSVTSAVDIGITSVDGGFLYDRFPSSDSRFYRVRAVPIDDPLDIDGDGIDDVYEFQRQDILNPLNSADAEEDPDGNGRTHLQEFLVDESSLAFIQQSSPFAGETGVALTRETVVTLTEPLSPASTVTSQEYYAESNGAPLTGRIQVSKDRKRLTLFYDELLPASSRVRVSLDGDNLVDVHGRPVDLDGDGEAGGSTTIDFDTLSITPVEGTTVVGRIFASELAPGDEGETTSVNRPLAGVTITVDGAESTLRTVTDSMGNFLLDPAPAGRFFIHVDGRTSPDSNWPSGDYYPFVGKAWVTRAGVENSVGEIFLPLVRAGTLQEVSDESDTEIQFSESILAENPGLEGVSITVPAGSLVDDTGVIGGMVGIAPVPPDRLPGQLPETLAFPIVITVQTDGPANFDVPAAVVFPNLPDPRTGETLRPREKTALWSFNHDTGGWEMQGSMTVSDDGLFQISDPGVGISAPGWHSTTPATSGSGPAGNQNNQGSQNGQNDPNCPNVSRTISSLVEGAATGIDCLDDGAALEEDFLQIVELVESLHTIRREVEALENRYTRGLAMTIVVEDLPANPTILMEFVNQLASESDPVSEYVYRRFTSAGGNAIADYTAGDISVFDFLPIFLSELNGIVRGESIYTPTRFAGIMLSPVTQALVDSFPTGLDSFRQNRALLADAYPDYLTASQAVTAQDVLNKTFQFEAAKSQLANLINGAVPGNNSPLRRLEFTADCLQRIVDRAMTDCQTLCARGLLNCTAVCQASFLTPGVSPGINCDVIIPSPADCVSREYKDFCAKAPLIQEGLDRLRLAINRLDSLNLDELCRPVDEIQDYLEAGPGNNALLRTASTESTPIDPELVRLLQDWKSTFALEGVPTEDERFLLQDFVLDGQDMHTAEFGGVPFAYLQMEHNGTVQRLRANDRGQYSFILPPDTFCQLTAYDPESNTCGRVWFHSSEAGITTRIHGPAMGACDPTDSDGDGLPDIAEEVVGTLVDVADTDEDGINDFAEIQQGLDPLRSSPLPTGLIGSVVGKTYTDLCVANNLVIAAHEGDENGIDIFNVFNGMAPVLIGNTPLSQAVLDLACDGNLIAVANGLDGLKIIDFRDPPTARVVRELRFTSDVMTVAASGGIAFVGLEDGNLHAVDLQLGFVLFSATASDSIIDLAIEGRSVYALTPTSVEVFSMSGGTLAPVGTSPTPPSPSSISVNVGRAFIGTASGYATIDLADPGSPGNINGPDAAASGWNAFAINGSGLGIAAAANPEGSINVFDVSDPTQTTALNQTFPTRGSAQHVAIHNALAYVADGDGGIAIYNYYDLDTLSVPPSIDLLAGFPLTPPAIEEGSRTYIAAAVADDIQVRSVEFLIDGRQIATDGNAPFELWFNAPLIDESDTFTIEARARDTGGGAGTTGEIEVQLLSDTTPPSVWSTSPAADTTAVQEVTSVVAVFSEPIDPDSVNGDSLLVVSAGPDSVLGTGDDIQISGTSRLRQDINALVFDLNTNPTGRGIISRVGEGRSF